MIKKIVQSLLAVSLFAAMAVSVDARSLDEILKSGVLKMGVNPGLPPLAKYDEKNNLVGFDPDIGAKLAEMLGVELELVKVGSPDRIPFVSTGKIDIVMGALTRNYKRQKEHIEQLYKHNMKYKVDYKEYDNFKLSMSCIDILNKGLLFFLTIYMLTTTSHSFTKIIYQGFSFFDWIVLFLCIIQLTCKTPILYMKS